MGFPAEVNLRDTHIMPKTEFAQPALRVAHHAVENAGMNVGANIRKIRKSRRMTILELANATDSDVGNISRLETGKQRYTEEKLVKIADALGVKVKDLFEDPSNVEPGPDFKSERKYPVISWVQAGTWTELCDNFEPGNADEWRECHKDLGKCGYVLRVKGESMTAPPGQPYTFPEGILLFVNPELEALPGKFVIVRRTATQEATFKRLAIVDGDLYLEALNPAWPNRYLKFEETDHICGVVVHAGFDMP